jgi:hypothetical protein
MEQGSARFVRVSTPWLICHFKFLPGLRYSLSVVRLSHKRGDRSTPWILCNKTNAITIATAFHYTKVPCTNQPVSPHSVIYPKHRSELNRDKFIGLEKLGQRLNSPRVGGHTLGHASLPLLSERRASVLLGPLPSLSFGRLIKCQRFHAPRLPYYFSSTPDAFAKLCSPKVSRT